MNDKEYTELSLVTFNLAKRKKGYLTFLMNKFNCGRQRAKDIYARLLDSKSLDTLLDLPENETELGSAIIAGQNYTYNQRSDKYIVPLTTYGRNYVCSGDQHRAMLAAYSNWDGSEQSIAKIARTYKMRREWLREYVKIMQWTHDSVPITDEEISLDQGQEAIRRVLDTKRTVLQQELQHEDWKQTQADAEKWNLFEAGKLDPCIRALENFKPGKFRAMKLSIPVRKQVKNVFVVGLSDLHIGQKATSTELTKGEDYNVEIANEQIDNYAQKIAQDITELNYTFEKCVIISAGDILHGLSGYTEKGTMLECDVLREEQFEAGLNCLQRFISRMLELFRKVEVHSTKGNHSAADWILFKALECTFNSNPRISFNNYKARTSIFRVKNTAILLDHGESDFIKAKVPTSDVGRESFVQNKFLELGDTVGKGIRSRIFIQGDKHHFEQAEFRSFEFIMLSSCVSGDRYSDHLGLHSRPRQNCLILDDNGIKQVLHYYLD
jgi:hypothetical protein